jgi:hypothetical protein
MEELAKKYGPIVYLHLGYLNHIVISSDEMALEVLKIHDAYFVFRPSSIIRKYGGFEYFGVVFSPYGDNWHLLHEICVTELSHTSKTQNFST